MIDAQNEYMVIVQCVGGSPHTFPTTAGSVDEVLKRYETPSEFLKINTGPIGGIVFRAHTISITVMTKKMFEDMAREQRAAAMRAGIINGGQ